jgi:hypothetical protein
MEDLQEAMGVTRRVGRTALSQGRACEFMAEEIY